MFGALGVFECVGSFKMSSNHRVTLHKVIEDTFMLAAANMFKFSRPV